MTKRILALLVCAVMMISAFAGCTGGTEAPGGDNAAPAGDATSPAGDGGQATDTPSGPSSGTLKLGIVLPITGESAKAGTEFRDAATMAFEEVDYKVGDWTIEPYWIDQTMDPEKGSLSLESAIIRDGIDCVILNWNSSVAVALMDVAAKYQVPYYFGIGASGEIDDKWNSDPEYYSYYIGKAWARSEYMATAYGYAIDGMIKAGTWEPRNQKVAIYGDDTDFGRSLGAAVKNDMVDTYGWECVFEEYFAPGTTDLYAILTKVKQSDASVVAGHLTNPASAAAFLKQARENNVQALTIVDALGEMSNFYDLSGSASDFVLDNRPKFATEAGLAFESAFEEKYGYKPAAATGGQVYDYTRFFLKCVEATAEQYGTVNKETLYTFGNEVLLTGGITFEDGVMCQKYEFGDPDFMPGPKVADGYYIFPILQYIDGEGVVVWPDDKKEADIVIPDYAK